jgi:hypothetical protein
MDFNKVNGIILEKFGGKILYDKTRPTLHQVIYNLIRRTNLNFV